MHPDGMIRFPARSDSPGVASERQKAVPQTNDCRVCWLPARYTAGTIRLALIISSLLISAAAAASVCLDPSGSLGCWRECYVVRDNNDDHIECMVGKVVSSNLTRATAPFVQTSAREAFAGKLKPNMRMGLRNSALMALLPG